MLDESGRAIHKGYCRNSAPACQGVGVVEYGSAILVRWPVVLATDWCGSFASGERSNGDGQNGSQQPEASDLARSDNRKKHGKQAW